MTYASPPPTPPSQGGFLDRVPPAAQVGVSAALLLPTLVLYFIRSELFNTQGGDWVITALTDVYFVVVVGVFARAGRRVGAILVGVLALALDMVTLAVAYLVPYSGLVGWGIVALNVVGAMAFVTTWGIARRRRPTWLVGLVPTFIISLLVALMYRLNWALDAFGSDFYNWFVFWVFWVGAFAVCCAICWAFDGKPKAAPQYPYMPGAYPPPAGYPPPASQPAPGGYPQQPTAFPQPGGFQNPGNYPQPGGYQNLGHPQPGGYENLGGYPPSGTGSPQVPGQWPPQGGSSPW